MTPAPGRPIPRATYRIQFTAAFDFAAAAGIADYLARLGVSHLYASPFLAARPGSTHGYDIVDHSRINPELGGEEGLRRLSDALRAAGLGQILDIVPNHMGVGGSDNAWWLDVLEWGADSPYAGYFDIDFEPDRRYLQGKVLAPVLGDQYGAVLHSGALDLRFDPDAASFAVWAYDSHKLPVCPRLYGEVLGRDHAVLERLGDAFAHLHLAHPHEIARAGVLKAELARAAREDVAVADAVAAAIAGFRGEPDAPESWQRLDRLIAAQHWRAAYFKVAADDINYRRFFNINDLAGLRMEEPELFERTHARVLGLLADGTLDGLRIDHIDGLYDPKDYICRLRQAAGRPFHLVVEKILSRHERLRADWDIEGTTGYEFATLVGGLFVDPEAEPAFSRLYAAFTGRAEPFEAVVRAAKLRIMESEMASELHVLAREAARIARTNPLTADFTVNILHRALKEVVAGFPVYRTYIDGTALAEEDRRDLDWAMAVARRAPEAPDPSVFDYLHRLLTTDLAAGPKSGYSRQRVVRFAMKFQQYSGPVMAKGLEDTAFYRFNRLVALNEVGGHPDAFGTPVASFHHANQERLARWPDALLATSTHDTKRGEDVRARLYALSEVPESWERMVATWSRLIRARRGDVEGTAPPDRNDEYLFYQLLLGAWPADLTAPSAEAADVGTLDAAAVAAVAERLCAAMTKSLREAKEHSTWAAPDAAYEQAMLGFVRDALDTSRRNAFLESFLPFQAAVAEAGMRNGLAQQLLKLTCPGVPDLYQGSELWTLSLVDPDNRAPVDFARHRDLLGRVESALEAGGDAMRRLAALWQDGAIKMAVTVAALRLRGERPDLFARGAYVPLEAQGERAAHLIAFARVRGEQAVLVAVPRLGRRLGVPPDWADTRLALPPELAGRRWRSLLTGVPVDPAAAHAPDTLFDGLPVALLLAHGSA